MSKPPPNVEGMFTLKVDNISYRTSAEVLREEFSKFGELGDVYIPRNYNTGEPRGFAFVRFADRRDGEDAQRALDGKVIDGRELKIQEAKERRPENPKEAMMSRRGYNDDRRGGGGYRGGGGRDDYGGYRGRSREREYGREYGRGRSRDRDYGRAGGDYGGYRERDRGSRYDDRDRDRDRDRERDYYAYDRMGPPPGPGPYDRARGPPRRRSRSRDRGMPDGGSRDVGRWEGGR